MSGDKRAELEAAYRKNRPGFIAWATKATRSFVDAEDLVQEAFAKALARAESLGGVDDLAAFKHRLSAFEMQPYRLLLR